MNSLTQILEEARAMQARNGYTMREALAIAMARRRRLSYMPETSAEDGGPVPLRIQAPAALNLDALLPRDREPTLEEIREAWKECVEQSSLYGGAERYEAVTETRAEPVQEDR
jgi:hypothetical protein